MDAFTSWWRRAHQLRERHGFALLFAFATPETNEFVAAYSFDGDLEDLQRRYYADDERVRLAAEATRWAVEHERAAGTGDAASVLGIHPGFSANVHIAEAHVIQKGSDDAWP